MVVMRIDEIGEIGCNERMSNEDWRWTVGDGRLEMDDWRCRWTLEMDDWRWMIGDGDGRWGWTVGDG